MEYSNEWEQYEHAGCTIHIVQDEDPISPREWTQLGRMACRHRDYTLGDEDEDPREIIAAVEDELYDATPEGEDVPAVTWERIVSYLQRERGATVVLPLALYDHSGITMYVGGRGDYPFDSAGWDTSNVGFIFDTAETREETGAPAGSEDQLRAEVREYDDYLRGYVCGYVVERDGVVIDSCYGFLGEWGIKAAREDAESAAERERDNAATLDFYASAH